MFEERISCPYCGALSTVLIEPSDINHPYIEDCQICCRPICFDVQADGEDSITVLVKSEDDV